jgi:hypothetical protein
MSEGLLISCMRRSSLRYSLSLPSAAIPESSATPHLSYGVRRNLTRRSTEDSAKLMSADPIISLHLALGSTRSRGSEFSRKSDTSQTGRKITRKTRKSRCLCGYASEQGWRGEVEVVKTGWWRSGVEYTPPRSCIYEYEQRSSSRPVAS